MKKYKSSSFNVSLDATHNECVKLLCRHINVKLTDISNIKLFSRSVDARKDVKYVVSYTFDCNFKPINAEEYIPQVNVLENIYNINTDISPIIVGSGPAGLFAALYMVNSGLKPVIIERGSDLPQRINDINAFISTQQLDCNSNVVFGLGGAGTFSDGKLTSGIKDERVFSVIDTFIKFGADEEIAISNKPHIGTDMLVKIVCNIRDYLILNGATFLFNTILKDINIVNNKLTAITYAKKQQITEINAQILVLATGHSARDIYYMLNSKGVNLSRKTFAVGVRIEHKQSMIDKAQYGNAKLIGADYKLVSKIKDKTVYTFCMCPGGEVVAATSDNNHTCVNGMSNNSRNSGYSNSALLVSIDENELKTNDLFEGIKFQQQLEQAAFNLVGDYRIPAQNSIDFINNKISTKLIFTPSVRIGVKNANIRTILSNYGDLIAYAITDMATKIPHFDTQGIVLGVESRSTSPLRIDRDINYQSNIEGLYPCGEGAGYAGGIVSAAVDGIRVAQQIVKALENISK